MNESLDKSEIYDQFAQVTKQTKDLLTNMEQLQVKITSVLEENAELSIENEHLHQIIDQYKNQSDPSDLSSSRQNLQKLYEQGFHVCNEYYGKRLDKNESCTFCLDAIFGRHQKQ
jgi:regulator of replication initiation timing